MIRYLHMLKLVFVMAVKIGRFHDKQRWKILSNYEEVFYLPLVYLAPVRIIDSYAFRQNVLHSSANWFHTQFFEWTWKTFISLLSIFHMVKWSMLLCLLMLAATGPDFHLLCLILQRRLQFIHLASNS